MKLIQTSKYILRVQQTIVCMHANIEKLYFKISHWSQFVLYPLLSSLDIGALYLLSITLFFGSHVQITSVPIKPHHHCLEKVFLEAKSDP